MYISIFIFQKKKKKNQVLKDCGSLVENNKPRSHSGIIRGQNDSLPVPKSDLPSLEPAPYLVIKVNVINAVISTALHTTFAFYLAPFSQGQTRKTELPLGINP